MEAAKLEQSAGPVTGEPVPPARRTPSMRPALLVLGVAVIVLSLFGLGAVLTGNGSRPPGAAHGTHRVVGTSLLAVPAGPLLAPIQSNGSPPANITANLTVPQGTQARGHAGGAGTQYDAHVDLAVTASQAAVVAFFRSELPRQGWKVFSVGPAVHQPLATEVLAQKPGTDGWYWELGAVVEPTTFASSAVPATAETTRFTLRLFQRSDEMS